MGKTNLVGQDKIFILTQKQILAEAIIIYLFLLLRGRLKITDTLLIYR
jgi:hypothetical protein